EKGDVINRPAPVQAVKRLVPEIGFEAFGILHIDTDDMDDAIVRLVTAEIKPQARKVEGRPIAFLENENIAVKFPRCLKIRCPDRKMRQLLNSHSDLSTVINYQLIGK